MVAVAIHKDFHPGHVLVGDDVCVIDLDEARNGDPAFDVAHFLGYLELISPDATRRRQELPAIYTVTRLFRVLGREIMIPEPPKPRDP